MNKMTKANMQNQDFNINITNKNTKIRKTEISNCTCTYASNVLT